MRCSIFTALCLLPLVAPASAQDEAPAEAKNSTRKIRAVPSEQAARAGSWVRWREDMDAAIAESKETGKPVFVYVPTIRGSFMDRKTEIDRYMLAGPFSWPRLITRLNDHFIPVRLEPTRASNERFGLKRIEFVEPGFLVLDGEGQVIGSQDEITTYHPDWYDAATAAFLEDVEPERTGAPGDLPLSGALDADGDASAALQAESRFLQAAASFWSGDEAGAVAAWSALARDLPDTTFGAKAAMEAEGHGPIVHGLEVWGMLPEGALVPSGDGTRVAPGVYDEAQLWTTGVDWLLRMQRSDGGWNDSTYDFGGTDGLPNVFVACSAIAARGLLEAAHRAPSEAIDAALWRAFEYLADESHTNPVDTDEIFWAHMYRVQTLARWIELRPDDRARVKPVLDRVTAKLIDLQYDSGAWGHEYPNPFCTADALVTLQYARRVGTEVGSLEDLTATGCSALVRCRTDEGAISYGQVRDGRKARGSVEGGVGRIPRVELALAMWNSKDASALDKAVALSFDHEHLLMGAQKYDDHTNVHAYGGFFFWYDLQARTDALMHLPDDAQRRAWIQRQRELIVSLAEIDGAFIDSHEVGRVYGTGMALWCLAMLGD